MAVKEEPMGDLLRLSLMSHGETRCINYKLRSRARGSTCGVDTYVPILKERRKDKVHLQLLSSVWGCTYIAPAHGAVPHIQRHNHPPKKEHARTNEGDMAEAAVFRAGRSKSKTPTYYNEITYSARVCLLRMPQLCQRKTHDTE